jgi:hypothetical protein
MPKSRLKQAARRGMKFQCVRSVEKVSYCGQVRTVTILVARIIKQINFVAYNEAKVVALLRLNTAVADS